MPTLTHPQYPPILARTVLSGPGVGLAPFPPELLEQLTSRLRTGQRRPTEVTRALLALCNLNFGRHAQDEALIHSELLGMGARELQSLGRVCTLALAQCKEPISVYHRIVILIGVSWRLIGQTIGGGPRPSSNVSALPPTQWSSESSESAKQRDDFRCILSKVTVVQVAHIIPYSLGRYPRPLDQVKPDIFKFLKFLAGPARWANPQSLFPDRSRT
ncbi:hypothetical protein EV426DRAFT_617258 [Tirmania nivea]|nr:hypothetical protein EV426DRAFT_617258 [Tirmania nivea]